MARSNDVRGDRHVLDAGVDEGDLHVAEMAELGVELLEHARGRVDAGDPKGSEAVDHGLRGPPGAAADVQDVVVVPRRDRQDQALCALDVVAHRPVVIGCGFGESTGDAFTAFSRHGRSLADRRWSSPARSLSRVATTPDAPCPGRLSRPLTGCPRASYVLHSSLTKFEDRGRTCRVNPRTGRRVGGSDASDPRRRCWSPDAHWCWPERASVRRPRD